MCEYIYNCVYVYVCEREWVSWVSENVLKKIHTHINFVTKKIQSYVSLENTSVGMDDECGYININKYARVKCG